MGLNLDQANLRRIVLVTQDGAMGNGQVFLLYYLRWLRLHTDIEVQLLAWEDGPLLDRFGELAPVRVLERLDEWRPARVAEVLGFQRVTQVLKSMRLRSWLLGRRAGDLLYVNGLEAARILGFLTGPGPRSVVHVHDPAELTSSRPSAADRELIARSASVFVAGSDEIAEALHGLGVGADRIVRHDYFIATGIDGPLTSLDPPGRSALGIGPDEFVVGTTGPEDWWAEPEQFVLWAWSLRRRLPDRRLRFLLIVGEPDERRLWPLRHDLANADLTDHTTIVTDPTPFDLLHDMDVLVLSTRNEPAELLVFEAAGAGTAVVGTDNLLRGSPARDSILVVPYLDIDALVDGVATLAASGSRRADLVERAREVASHHHDVSVGAPALLAEILSRT